MYKNDLTLVPKSHYPKNIPITIFDTDFEQKYIDNSKDKETKQQLLKWKKEGVKYYKSLVSNSNKGKYIPLSTQQHLLMFSQPEIIIKELNR